MSKDSIQQRMAAWMADYEDPTGAFRAVPDRDTLLDTAFDIMKECYPKFVTSAFIEDASTYLKSEFGMDDVKIQRGVIRQ